MNKENLEQFSLQQLEELKRKNYKLAENNGWFCDLGLVAEMFDNGNYKYASYGPKYEFTKDDVKIYVDNYGGYMTVYVGDKLVASTHNEKLFIPGAWFDGLRDEIENAKVKSEQLAEKKNEEKKDRMIREMSI